MWALETKSFLNLRERNVSKFFFFNFSKAIPGYNERTNPFVIALNNSWDKLVMINTQTQAVLDIAVLKRNHEDDRIEQESI